MRFAAIPGTVTGNSVDESNPVTSGVARRALTLLVAALSAKAALLTLRAHDVAAYDWLSGWTWLAFLHQDVALVAAFFVSDATLTRLSGKYRGALAKLAWGAVAALVFYTAINVPVARVFSTPLTAAMFGAAGGALSDSIWLYATGANLAAIGFVLGAATCAAFVRCRLRGLVARSAIPLAAVVTVLGAHAAARSDYLGLHRNAVFALGSTWLARHGRPLAPPSASLPEVPSAPEPDLSALAGAARGRDVIWIILESTAARYLGSYGVVPDPTPNLTRLAQNAVVFEAAYSAYPESIKGLLSMLCSTYPAAYASAADYVADRYPCPAIASLLARAGYRTAFFHSGHFRYLGMRGIVQGRGFDVAFDAQSVGGSYRTSFGTDDAATVRRLLAYVDELGSSERLFAVYSPISGHHPYRSPGNGPRPRPEHDERDCYFNDLYAGDAALGSLLDGLGRRGRLERTLFLIVGDHGEAFGQHPGNFAHTLFLYEENVHVPFIIAAPGLMHGRRTSDAVASLVDLAPTTLDLLGLAPHAEQRGRSLLRPGAGIALFQTDQGPLKLGLRHGRYKCLHETEYDRTRLFDLRSDPGEARDLAAAFPERAAQYRAHLLGWAADERERLERKASSSELTSRASGP